MQTTGIPHATSLTIVSACLRGVCLIPFVNLLFVTHRAVHHVSLRHVVSIVSLRGHPSTASPFHVLLIPPVLPISQCLLPHIPRMPQHHHHQATPSASTSPTSAAINFNPMSPCSSPPYPHPPNVHSATPPHSHAPPPYALACLLSELVLGGHIHHTNSPQPAE